MQTLALDSEATSIGEIDLVIFAVRKKFFEAMLSDPEWSRKLDEAKTLEHVQDLVEAYAQTHGYKVKALEE